MLNLYWANTYIFCRLFSVFISWGNCSLANCLPNQFLCSFSKSANSWWIGIFFSNSQRTVKMNVINLNLNAIFFKPHTHFTKSRKYKKPCSFDSKQTLVKAFFAHLQWCHIIRFTFCMYFDYDSLWKFLLLHQRTCLELMPSTQASYCHLFESPSQNWSIYTYLAS